MTDTTQNLATDGNTVLDEPGGGELHVHVVPLWMLAGVFAILIFLTVLTVAVTYVDLGSMNLWIAMIIAGVKAILVAAIFMHLAFDKSIYSVIFFSAIFFVVLFIGLLLMDTAAYQPDMIPGYAPGISQ